MSVDAILNVIAQAGFLVCDLGQRRILSAEENQDTAGWMAKLRSRGAVNDPSTCWYEAGYGATPEEALRAALKFARDPTPRNNNIPRYLTKAIVSVVEQEPKSLEDML